MSDRAADLALLALAQTTAHAREPLARLSRAGSPEQLLDALERALTMGNTRMATALALAGAAAGAKIPAPLLMRLVPDLDNIHFLPILTGAADGDRLEVLLDLAATERLSWERESMVLFLAARLVEGAEPPPRLTARLRSLLREPLTIQAASVAGMAAALVPDPEVRRLATGMQRTLGNYGKATGMDTVLWKMFTQPALDMVPEEEDDLSVSGHTVVRAEPKIGRNDPCPCGSGRKYKKCCADKEAAAPPPPPARAIVQQFRAAPRMQQHLFDDLRPAELEQLDLEPLTAQQLVDGMERLATHHRWEGAERYAEALAARPGGGARRVGLAHAALRAGQLDLAERQMALAPPDEREQLLFGTALAVARRSPDALERLEALLRIGHAGADPALLVDCAHGLLHHSPALGILVARGVMSVDRLAEAVQLLQSIGKARDALGLPSAEPWDEVFDVLLEARAEHEDEDNDAEVEKLREQLRAAADRARRLAEEVSRREKQLATVSGEREQLAAAVEAQQGRDERQRVAELEEERRRLRTKIEALKGEVTEGAAQRAQLRRELARSAEERNRTAVAAAPQQEHDEEALADDAEGDAVTSRPRRILIPQFSPAASKALATVPARVAAQALQAAARLAGGDAHVWSGAKHMQLAHDVLSVRAGRTWRLLFRMSEERLEVVDFVHRSDLHEAIARL